MNLDLLFYPHHHTTTRKNVLSCLLHPTSQSPRLHHLRSANNQHHETPPPDQNHASRSDGSHCATPHDPYHEQPLHDDHDGEHAAATPIENIATDTDASPHPSYHYH